jgi:hypothetical protein
VFRLPLRNVTPFALAGVGALIFYPSDFAGASTQTRAAFVYGAGADIRLSHHISCAPNIEVLSIIPRLIIFQRSTVSTASRIAPSRRSGSVTASNIRVMGFIVRPPDPQRFTAGFRSVR